MMSQKIFIILLSLLAAVYGLGLFSGLLENDSAQFAVMAMRMVQESDFWSLYKGTAPYLDKPHLHYWLAAASYKIFGIHEWSYKLPGLLALFLGGYSVYALAKHLYNTQVARVAALLFLSAQTIVLSGIDLRTDALLTGFVALALWQFV
ncbi:MAG: 4-amino-4-deoxy-L-arabinose transferase-like glycosyltransferase, partial [Flavobacteriaceae bacterium]